MRVVCNNRAGKKKDCEEMQKAFRMILSQSDSSDSCPVEQRFALVKANTYMGGSKCVDIKSKFWYIKLRS